MTDDFSFFPPPPVPPGPGSAAAYPYVAPQRPSRTADVIVTSLLLALYWGGFAFVAFFSLFGMMITDSCGVNDCNYGNMNLAYILLDGVGGIVLLAASIAAIVLMARRRIAFWVPLAGIAIQCLLLAAWVGLMGTVVP
ncbi:hypothetical protein ACQ7HM_14040 [Williamsia sp. MIQD14]|uniref:hypothetical protein n=1 Tax=Williamsia sp. MIQD14 TaxID=3425703 RepID=UPI003D9FBBE2